MELRRRENRGVENGAASAVVTIDEVGDMERPKLKLDQAHFRAFAGWEFRDERLMQLELIDAIESEGVDPTPPPKDDGCISCCVTQ